MTSDYDRLRQLFIEKISGIISAEDEQLLQQWLANDSGARDTWNALLQEAELLDVDRFMEDTDPKRDLSVLKEAISPRQRRHLSNWQAAAAGLLLTAAGFYFMHRNQLRQPASDQINTQQVTTEQGTVRLTTDDGQSIDLRQTRKETISLNGMRLRTDGEELYTEPTDEEVRMNTLFVPAKEHYRIVLPDGSKVWLNSASKLRFPSRFTGPDRTVELDGEGYFEIQANKEQPFIVHTERAQILVLGTSFNLRAYTAQPLHTALIDGGVRLTADNGRSVQLAPGDAAEYTGKGVLNKSAFDPDEVLAWREGIYYFHNTSLEDLAIVIERWYGLSVTFNNPKIARQTVSGMLEKGHISHFLSDLNASLGIRYALNTNTLQFL